jgi:hypothetical protein
VLCRVVPDRCALVSLADRIAMSQVTPTPFTCLLVRTLLTVCALSWLLSASAFGAGAPAPCEAATAPRRFPHRPIYCDLLTGLAVDLLNDNENRVPALKAKVGEIGPGGFARFHVYALTDDIRLRDG